MSLKLKQIFICSVIFATLCINNLFTIGTNGLSSDDPVVVLFDEGHGQFFNRSLYSQAISDLIVNKSMKFVYNKGEFNTTSFKGVDIFLSTNPNINFIDDEITYINRFLAQGASMFLLSNPIDEDNETLNGRGDIFNQFMGNSRLEFGMLMGKFWIDEDFSDSYKPTDVVHNEFSNAGDPRYLRLKLNSSSHDILSKDNNITSIVTYTSSIASTTEEIILASPEANARTHSGTIHSVTSNIILLGASGDDLEADIRILLGGSSTMFSNLNGPYENRSWYESENNSLLWHNIFEWLAETSVKPPDPAISVDQLILMMSTIIGVSIILILGGGFMYKVGSGRTITITKSEEKVVTKPKPSKDDAISPESVESKPPEKETKRDKRLKQIKKHRHRRRK